MSDAREERIVRVMAELPFNATIVEPRKMAERVVCAIEAADEDREREPDAASPA